jgi:hypothetical protein
MKNGTDMPFLLHFSSHLLDKEKSPFDIWIAGTYVKH